MRLYSSRQIVRALERLGCQARGKATRARKSKGSHRVYSRVVTLPDGTKRTLSAPILLGQKEMDRFTLAHALKLLGISDQEFEGAVR